MHRQLWFVFPVLCGVTLCSHSCGLLSHIHQHRLELRFMSYFLPTVAADPLMLFLLHPMEMIARAEICYRTGDALFTLPHITQHMDFAVRLCVALLGAHHRLVSGWMDNLHDYQLRFDAYILLLLLNCGEVLGIIYAVWLACERLRNAHSSRKATKFGQYAKQILISRLGVFLFLQIVLQIFCR